MNSNGRLGVGASEGEHPPAVRVSVALALRERATRILINGGAPKGKASAVGLRDAYNPLPRESVPEEKRGLTPNSGSTVVSENKELRDIEMLGIIGDRRPTGDESEAGRS